MSLITAVVLLWLTEAVSPQMILVCISEKVPRWSNLKRVRIESCAKQQQTLQALKERHFSLLLTGLLAVMLLRFLLCVVFSRGCFSKGEESSHRKLFKLQLAQPVGKYLDGYSRCQ